MLQNLNPLRWKTEKLEVLMLALTLLATVAISYATMWQTTNHFRIERTTAFVSRFNSKELVDVREDVDRWVRLKQPAMELYWESGDPGATSNSSKTPTNAAAAKATVANLRTLTNFFEEFGASIEAKTLDESLAYQQLGGVSKRYAQDLDGFIKATRKVRGRETEYSEVYWLAERMTKLDHKGNWRVTSGRRPEAVATPEP